MPDMRDLLTEQAAMGRGLIRAMLAKLHADAADSEDVADRAEKMLAKVLGWSLGAFADDFESIEADSFYDVLGIHPLEPYGSCGDFAHVIRLLPENDPCKDVYTGTEAEFADEMGETRPIRLARIHADMNGTRRLQFSFDGDGWLYAREYEGR